MLCGVLANAQCRISGPKMWVQSRLDTPNSQEIRTRQGMLKCKMYSGISTFKLTEHSHAIGYMCEQEDLLYEGSLLQNVEANHAADDAIRVGIHPSPRGVLFCSYQRGYVYY